MARIIDFRVEGLAGRTEPVEATLDPGLNVIWGYNGAGKTTLLTILHAALSGQTDGMARLSFRTARVRIRLADHSSTVITRTYRKTRNEQLLQLEETFEDAHEAPDGEWKTSISGARDGYIPRSFSHTYLPISRVTEYATVSSRYSHTFRSEAVSQASLNQLFANQVSDRWRQYYLESTRSTQRIQERAIGAILSILFGGLPEGDWELQSTEQLDDETAYRLVERFFKQRAIASSLSRSTFVSHYRGRAELHQVVALIHQATDQVDSILQPQEEFRELISDLFVGDKRIEFDHKGIQVSVGDQNIPLYSLSSGERQLIQILLEVMAARANPVLIDEPELSLHVDWQSRLVSAARHLNPRCQILLATHSPEILAEIPDGEAFEL